MSECARKKVVQLLSEELLAHLKLKTHSVAMLVHTRVLVTAVVHVTVGIDGLCFLSNNRDRLLDWGKTPTRRGGLH